MSIAKHETPEQRERRLARQARASARYRERLPQGHRATRTIVVLEPLEPERDVCPACGYRYVEDRETGWCRACTEAEERGWRYG